MARQRDPRRDEALEIFKQHDGDIANRAIAEQLGVPEKTISAWKSRDKWNVVLQTNECSTTNETTNDNNAEEVIIQALRDGHIVYSFNNDEVVVEQDINTFPSFTPKKNQDFRKGKIDRGMSIIENNTRHIFRKYFIGKVNNNADGRDLFKKQLMKTVLDPYVRLGVIDPYLPEEIVIEQGHEKDAVFAVMGIKFIDAMEKLYMRVECK